MITANNLKNAIEVIGFTESENQNVMKMVFPQFDCNIKVDFENKIIIYPEDKSLKINDRTTCNFDKPENFVVLECVCRLLKKGYRPEHIELEKRWNLGHDQKGGKADICIYDKDGKNMLCIIECKTYGTEYSKAISLMKVDGGQLFSYWQQERSTKWLSLYCSNFDGNEIVYKSECISCNDDANILQLAQKDNSILVYKNSHTVTELFLVWDETYEKNFNGDVIFNEDTQSYNIGIKQLKKKDLIDFSEDDKIVNKFEEILRHNNVSDKENAFNRLIALFICKLVDEINKGPNDVVEFQYKVGTDTYESLQDRLQRLHQQGMDEFMKEKIFYVADDYAEKLVQQFTGSKREKMIEELNKTLRVLKFYTNNDFAFKDVHNEELFYQNGKVLVEVIQLFQKFRIIESNNLQFLGDLFEQLLNKGFKQNEGQFFTPVPITRFIWNSLPLEIIMKKEDKIVYPKIIDYACGAGHFLTEGFEAVNRIIAKNQLPYSADWIGKKIYGVEKDYRLARVSKISLFMHGAGNGNIIFGDGLENYIEKDIENNSFDILVANPPYSVSAFKPHLKLKNNDFELLKCISNDGSEIETLFVERIGQLLKPNAIGAIILPSSIMNKESNSFVAARESILKNFKIKAIVQFGGKTFGATGTNTVVLFLQKYNEPPKRIDLISDSIESIFNSAKLDEWEDKDIAQCYSERIGVSFDDFSKFINKEEDYNYWSSNEYYSRYTKSFVDSILPNITKLKNYRNMDSLKQKEIQNQKFYEIALKIEKEKIFYFALTYRQTTVVISSPTDNSEQEKFLGYKWSNRKGQEGIQIIKQGGQLFNETNFDSLMNASGIVRSNFFDNKVNVDSLMNYYFYSRLDELIDFDSYELKKTIKLTKTRVLKKDKEYTNYRLDNDIFELSIGNRVLSEEIEAEGIPVYSANVFEEFGRINKKNLKDFERDSILWGIDGDWMVNTIPAGKEFYPTDHCGVIRIKSNLILTDYFALSLKVAGEYERFNRNNRASTERIKKLIIQIPSVETQRSIMREFNKVNSEINEYKKKLSEYDEQIKSKFDELFAGENENTALKNIASVKRGSTITREQTTDGDIPVVAGGLNPSCYHNVANRDKDIITISSSGANAGFVNYWDVPIFASDCNTVNSLDKDEVSNKFIYYFLHFKQDEIYKLQPPEAGQPHVYGTDIEKIKIFKPNPDKQRLFLTFVNSIDKLKFKANSEIERLNKEYDNLLTRYFR